MNCNIDSSISLFHTFEDVLERQLALPENFLNPKTDFSRQRKISLSDVVRLPFIWGASSLDEFVIGTSFSSVTPSAISQARTKILSSFYEHVFKEFNKETDFLDSALYKNKYRLVAVDGSSVKILKQLDQDDLYTKTKNGSLCYHYHFNGAYDVLNHTFTDYVIQPGCKKNEDSAFEQIALGCQASNTIFIADRGYESLIGFLRLNREGKKFVIRIKDESSYTSILKYYKTPGTAEYDTSFNVILTPKNNRKVKDNRDLYKYISSYRKLPEFDDGKTEYELNLRVVRYKAVSEGEEQLITVITNLPEDEFTSLEIAEIYRYRWQIELAYRYLKSELGWEDCHSKRKEQTLSELIAKIALFNFCSRIRNLVQKSHKWNEHLKKVRKYAIQLNFKHIIYNLLSWIKNGLPVSEQEIVIILTKKWESVRPNRVDKRKKKK